MTGLVPGDGPWAPPLSDQTPPFGPAGPVSPRPTQKVTILPPGYEYSPTAVEDTAFHVFINDNLTLVLGRPFARLGAFRTDGLFEYNYRCQAENADLRDAYTTYVQLDQKRHGHYVLPACTRCGEPTGCYCDTCRGPHCTRCDASHPRCSRCEPAGDMEQEAAPGGGT